MEQDEKIISIEKPKGEFEKFLDIDNKRVFFSGSFGSGKTFFLTKFFKEDHLSNYDTYHLFPVRYQVLNNENIIDLLKYDILIELLQKYPEVFEVENKEVNSFKLFIAFCKDNLSVNSVLRSIIGTSNDILSLSPDIISQTLSRIGRPLNESLIFDQKFQEFKKEYSKGKKEFIDKFINNTQEKINNIGSDYLTQLINQKIKEKKGDKRSVLILDDFDRMDPEHIFRILNVLSVHMDGYEENKFGFDHVIIVGDQNNIRKIFAHKYGQGTDFDGYFDKFFTKKIFIFDNKQAVIEKLPYLLTLIKYEDPELKDAIKEGGIIKHLLTNVLIKSINVNKNNLRLIYRPIDNVFPELSNGVYGGRSPFSDGRSKILDIGTKLLIAIYGDKNSFLDVLKEIRDNVTENDTKEQWLYSNYCNVMLRSLLNIKPDERTKWLGKYMIIASQNQSNSSWIDFKLEGETKASAKFFYDTFIEYIRNSKYEKSWQEYEY